MNYTYYLNQKVSHKMQRFSGEIQMRLVKLSACHI